MATRRRNLDVYLQQVSEQFVAIKYDDFRKSQEVFKCVFDQIKKNMEKQCNYFNRYASQVTFGGSVSDGIKVGRLDEFDMDIVIRLPVSYMDGEDGIILEPDSPGYVRVKIVNGFDHLDKQKDWENFHKVTRDWRDSDKYLLQNKFRFWFNSVVQKALNAMGGCAVVDGKTYLLKYKAAGPAYTLLVRSAPGDATFHLDIDLVPVIRFMLPRWPHGYRSPSGKSTAWFVVPKPNKAETSPAAQNRGWRLSFQDFEREMIKDCKNLKITIRLVKKLRDAMGMKPIASYYIKTLFLWKIYDTNCKRYWETKLSDLFRDMVEILLDAVKTKNIPYFWNKNYNLIESLKPSLQAIYAEKLSSLLRCIEEKDVEKSTVFLLTRQEQAFFKTTPFYKAIHADSSPNVVTSQVRESKTKMSFPAPLKDDTSVLLQQLRMSNERAESLSAQVDIKDKEEMEGDTRFISQASQPVQFSCSVQ